MLGAVARSTTREREGIQTMSKINTLLLSLAVPALVTMLPPQAGAG
jgi:hypothetical protein